VKRHEHDPVLAKRINGKWLGICADCRKFVPAPAPNSKAGKAATAKAAQELARDLVTRGVLTPGSDLSKFSRDGAAAVRRELLARTLFKAPPTGAPTIVPRRLLPRTTSVATSER
jgi:hypothetical protein